MHVLALNYNGSGCECLSFMQLQLVWHGLTFVFFIIIIIINVGVWSVCMYFD